MKHFKNYFMLLAVCGLLFTSCSKDEDPTVTGNENEKATLSFGTLLNDMVNDKASLKQALPACSDDTPAFVEVVLSGPTNVGTMAEPLVVRVNPTPGNYDGDDEVEYFTEESADLELTPGTYTLEYFSVYNGDPDAAGTERIWVAPMTGGDLANFVTNPLPMDINLGAGEKRYVDVEVLCFDNRMVNQYGYLFFDLETTEAFVYCFYANYCPPSGRHYPAAFSVNVWLGDDATGTLLYEDATNFTGINDDGEYYTVPFCIALPNLAQYADDEDYLYYEVTLIDSEAYGEVEPQTISGTLSRNDVEANFDGDDNVDYEHLRFGCDDTGGGDDNGDGDGDDNGDGDNGDGDGDDNGDGDGDDNGDGDNGDGDNGDGDNGDGDDNGDTDGDLEGCDTAFMVGDVELNDLGYPGNNWGWAEHFTNEGNGEYIYEIFAGAGQNDTSRGNHVGYASLTVDGNNVTLEVNYFDGVDVNDLHVYIGDSAPDSRAPGQFDNQDNSMTYQFTDVDGEFWFIVHAEVCPE